jgi:predicted ABC-class ATPase
MPAASAVPFSAPDPLAVTLAAPHRGAVRGLGVRAGVTLIVGGGFHGKSTLLDAIQVGCYNKVRDHISQCDCWFPCQTHDCSQTQYVWDV